MQTIKTNIDLPIFKITAHNHKILKPLILEAIKNMGTYGVIVEGQQITNTDWHREARIERPYYQHIKSIIEDASEQVRQFFNYKNNDIRATNYWYQQYSKGDYHDWHYHGDSTFSCVYYVDLNKDNPKTTFRINRNEFEVEVSEGEVLIFPGFLEHTSKENNSDGVKTIISFNINT